jgi:hypothetical protein
MIARVLGPMASLSRSDIADIVRHTWDPDVVPNRYVGDGRLMEELAAEARLSLRSLLALVHATSAWLRRG